MFGKKKKKDENETTFISSDNLYVVFLGVVTYKDKKLYCTDEGLNKKFTIVQKMNNRMFYKTCKSVLLNVEYRYFFDMDSIDTENMIGQVVVYKEIHISQFTNLVNKKSYSLSEIQKIEEDINKSVKKEKPEINNVVLNEAFIVSKKLHDIDDEEIKSELKKEIQVLAANYSSELIDLKTRNVKIELTEENEEALNNEYMEKLKAIENKINDILNEASIKNDLQILNRKLNE